MLAKNKTDQLYLASFPCALPDIHQGIRTKTSRPDTLTGSPYLRHGPRFAGILT